MEGAKADQQIHDELVASYPSVVFETRVQKASKACSLDQLEQVPLILDLDRALQLQVQVSWPEVSRYQVVQGIMALRTIQTHLMEVSRSFQTEEAWNLAFPREAVPTTLAN